MDIAGVAGTLPDGGLVDGGRVGGRRRVKRGIARAGKDDVVIVSTRVQFNTRDGVRQVFIAACAVTCPVVSATIVSTSARTFCMIFFLIVVIFYLMNHFLLLFLDMYPRLLFLPVPWMS